MLKEYKHKLKIGGKYLQTTIQQKRSTSISLKTPKT
jgi:hypothetical protein